MKIIGKAKHDYYDSGAMYGIDETHVLVRNPQRLPINGHKVYEMCGYGASRKHINNSVYEEVYQDKNDSALYYDVKMMTLFFCGEVYYVFNVSTYKRVNGQVKIVGTPSNICTVDAFVKFTAKFKKPLTAKDVYREFIGSILFYLNDDHSTTLKNESTSHANDIAKLLQVPYFLITFDINTSTRRHEYYVETYPCLGELGFGRIKDSITCFNEIDFYMFSILPSDKELIEIEDRDKVFKKGFDPEYGFRTRPEDGKKSKKSS